MQEVFDMCIPYLCFDANIETNNMKNVLLKHLIKIEKPEYTLGNLKIIRLLPLSRKLDCFDKYNKAHYEEHLKKMIEFYNQLESRSPDEKMDLIETKRIACKREQRWVMDDAMEWMDLFETLTRHFKKVLFFYTEPNVYYTLDNVNFKKLFAKKRIVEMENFDLDLLFLLKPEQLLEIQS